MGSILLKISNVSSCALCASPYIVLIEQRISLSFFSVFTLAPCIIYLVLWFKTVALAGIIAEVEAFPKFCPSSLCCISLPKMTLPLWQPQVARGAENTEKRRTTHCQIEFGMRLETLENCHPIDYPSGNKCFSFNVPLQESRNNEKNKGNVQEQAASKQFFTKRERFLLKGICTTTRPDESNGKMSHVSVQILISREISGFWFKWNILGFIKTPKALVFWAIWFGRAGTKGASVSPIIWFLTASQ